MASKKEEPRQGRHSHINNDYSCSRTSKAYFSTSNPNPRRRRSREKSSGRHSTNHSKNFFIHSIKRPISPLLNHKSTKKSRKEDYQTNANQCKKSDYSQRTSKNGAKSAESTISSTILPEVNVQPETANSCPSAHLPLDLEALDKRSEQRLREEKMVYLPDSNTFYFEKQKEQYYTNMYRLIVTARSQMQQLEKHIGLLNERLDSKSIVTCPHCQHNFATGPNRYLPKYIKVLKSTNRVELQFNDGEHLKNWMVGADLDRDAKGIPCLINEKTEKETRTLGNVESTLVVGRTEKRSIRPEQK